MSVHNLNQFIFSKIFIPMAWLMGVEWEDCGEVARLIGLKTVVNEFVAYKEMGEGKGAGILSVSIFIFSNVKVHLITFGIKFMKFCIQNQLSLSH